VGSTYTTRAGAKLGPEGRRRVVRGKLSSRRALVTGAAREIGRGIALGFAEENCAVAVAAKAGVHGFTRVMVWELAPHGITVNAIAPGPIERDLLRVIRRIG
jgi:NAD(P)-dependent dehydrogenase (short-subunit alcohol dehydrogenase family)